MHIANSLAHTKPAGCLLPYTVTPWNRRYRADTIRIPFLTSRPHIESSLGLPFLCISPTHSWYCPCLSIPHFKSCTVRRFEFGGLTWKGSFLLCLCSSYCQTFVPQIQPWHGVPKPNHKLTSVTVPNKKHY